MGHLFLFWLFLRFQIYVQLLCLFYWGLWDLGHDMRAHEAWLVCGNNLLLGGLCRKVAVNQALTLLLGSVIWLVNNLFGLDEIHVHLFLLEILLVAIAHEFPFELRCLPVDATIDGPGLWHLFLTLEQIVHLRTPLNGASLSLEYWVEFTCLVLLLMLV